MKNFNTIKNLKNFQNYSTKYLYIRQKNNLVTNLIFNKEQLYISKLLEQQKQEQGKIRSIILKARQIGITTLIASIAFHKIITLKGLRGFAMAHSLSATANIYNMMQRYYKNLPQHLQPKASFNRNKLIDFPKLDSSYVFSTAGGTEVARSETIQFFHGSEVAFWKNEDNHLASVLMAVPDSTNSIVLLESTSNGPKGLFYEMCLQAQKDMQSKDKDSKYQFIFIPWFWHTEYTSQENFTLPKAWLTYGKDYKLSESQIRWAYSKNKTLSVGEGADFYEQPSFRFYKEFPASPTEAFKYSNQNMLINLESIRDKALPKEQNTWEQTIKQKYILRQYSPMIIGVDVARGGGDLSWIIDRQGEFLGFNINERINTHDTMELVGLLMQYIKKYKPLKVCIDTGGGGAGVYDRLKECGYIEILTLVNFASKAVDSRKYLNMRVQMWVSLKNHFVEGGYIIDDPNLLQQICSAQYFYNSQGQLQLESKEIIKQRLKASPDGADAAALTFAYSNFNHGNNYNSINKNIITNEFDPFQW